MTCKLQNIVGVQVQTFSSILDQLGMSQTDLVIITNFGKKIFTQRCILSIFSKSVTSLISSLSSCPSDSVSIIVDASYESVCNMLQLLTKGEVSVENEEMLFDLLKTAELFSIDIKNLTRGHSKKAKSDEEGNLNFVDENQKTIKIKVEEEEKENEETNSMSKLNQTELRLKTRQSNKN